MDMASLGIANVAAITVLCFLCGQIVKAVGLDAKWVPIVCGIVGIGLGIVGLLIMPDFPATDYLSAAAVGAVSGLASTGLHQVYKQLGS